MGYYFNGIIIQIDMRKREHKRINIFIEYNYDFSAIKFVFKKMQENKKKIYIMKIELYNYKTLV
ncbi:hypothetical protein YYE_01790 [Plasmodium vinckei vinckei]|nr:hypothetical protein YYE_01790 [Plasmodium vinckei vinckei]